MTLEVKYLNQIQRTSSCEHEKMELKFEKFCSKMEGNVLFLFLRLSYLDASCIRLYKFHELYSRKIRRDDIKIFVFQKKRK